MWKWPLCTQRRYLCPNERHQHACVFIQTQHQITISVRNVKAVHLAGCTASSFCSHLRNEISLMIPDNTYIFNQPVVPRNFDDFETRLRYRLGQDALLTLEGGRHLLYTCPVCQHPWYKAGRREYPRLTSEQLACLSS